MRAPRSERPRLAVPDGSELARLVEAAKGTRWEVPVLLAAATGARRSEVLAITWTNLDLQAGRVRIVQGLQRVPDGDRGTRLKFLDVKTQRSRREIALPGFAVEALRAHRREQAERRLRLGAAWEDNDLVCERGDGRPLEPGQFSHTFKSIAKRAGLPASTRLHDVRHGVATAMLSKAVHPAIASAVLGHSTPAFKMSVYQHVLDGMTDVAAEALEQAIGGAGAAR